jgi:GntR family transcriptional repressor for pyruvate dehydrogenase complex
MKMEAAETGCGLTLPEIARKLWKMILDDGLQVGDRLPPERSLAERFGVSRGVVRLGIQSLVERGILTKRQGAGNYVSSVSADVFVKESMGMALRVKADLLADTLEFRRILEPQTAFLAARRISTDELDALKILVCNQQLKSGKPEGDLDAAFHLKLAEFSGNSVLFKVMGLMSDILSESRAERYQSDTRRAISIAGHLRIIKALEEKNPESAFRAMRDHLDAVEALVVDDEKKKGEKG